jgi:hypothetical protein
MCHPSYLKAYGKRICSVRELILLRVETKISAAILPKTEELKQLAGIILLMVGTNFSTGYVLILLMAEELARLASSSFLW